MDKNPAQLQLLLRLPESIADRVRKAIRLANGSEQSAYTSSASASSYVDAETLESLRIFEDDSPNAKQDDFIFEMRLPSTEDNSEIKTVSYPALLCSLPCVVETHKTYDKVTFYKSNDIGQVLQVFNSADERETLRTEIRRFASDGFDGVNPTGLTPPTSYIVPRKFLRTRPKDQGKFSREELTELINEISTSPLSDGLLHQPENVYIDSTPYEEVVEFEDWMVSEKQPGGISFTLTDNEWNKDNIILQAHPEILQMEGDEDIDGIVEKVMDEKKVVVDLDFGSSDSDDEDN